MTQTIEFRDACKRGPAIANRAESAAISKNWSADLDAVHEALGLVVKYIGVADGLLTQKSKVRILDKFETLSSLQNAVVKIALSLSGGRVFSADDFKVAVEAVVDPGHREHWALQSGGLMFSILHENPRIAEELLYEHGILCWDVLDTDPVDHNLRIVNTRFLVTPAEIYAHVVNEPKIGKFCRYCLAKEAPDSRALEPLNPTDRSADATTAGMAGERIKILQTGIVETHPRCAVYWLDCVRMAEQFEQEAA